MRLIEHSRNLLQVLGWTKRLFRGRSRRSRWLPEQLEVRLLLSTMTLSGTSGNDVITFQQTDATHDTFTLNGTPTTFNTSGVTAITINSSAGSDQITVLSDNSGIPLTVTGSGADTVHVGNAGSVQGINGTLILSGTTGQMTLTADDSADTTARTVNVFTTAVNFLAPAPIHFTSGQLASIDLKGGSGGNTFHVFSTANASPVTISGGAGNNTLIGSAGTEFWELTGTNSGSFSTTNGAIGQGVTFSNFQNLTGGSGTNWFSFHSGGSVSGLISGGANDLLNYGNYNGPATSIAVNLSSNVGTASFTGGVSGIRNVFGTVQDSQISDMITASPSGSTILPGAGSNTLVGGSGDDIFYLSVNPVAITIDGGGGNNTIVDYADNMKINVTGQNAGTINGGGSFTNVQNLMGGGDKHNFVTLAFSSGGSISGTIDGGGGDTWLQGSNSANTWAVTGNESGTYDGMAFVNILVLKGGTSSDVFSVSTSGTFGIIGGGGNDTLIGPDQINAWNITGINSETLNAGGAPVNGFSGIQNLVGGSGNDTFSFGPSGIVSGNVNGGGGTNTLDYSGHNTGVTVSLQTNSASTVDGSVTNIQNVVGSPANDQIGAAAGGSVISGDGGNDTLIGGAGNDTFILASNQGTSTIVNGAGGTNTLVGSSVANTWNVTSSGGGTLNGANFSKIQNLIGGTANDTFAFGPSGVVSGTVNGGGGNDTLDDSGRSVGVVVNLQTNSVTAIGGGVTNVQNVIGTPDNDLITAASGGTVISGDGGNDTLLGGAGNDTFILASNQGSSTYVNGAGGTNTLVGPNVANAWNITSSGGGTLNGAAFANVQNLTGGTANNTFAFGPSGAVSGTVSGGVGTDTLDYSGRSSGVIVNLQTSSATGISGFANIDSLIGSTGSDTLIGQNTTNTWNISGANSGSSGALAFSGIENLTGGTGNDAFAFASGGSVSGQIRGGGGTDTLDYSALATGVVVDLSNGVAAHVGGVSAVQNVIGSMGNDSITAGSGGSVITANGGTDTLIGGPGNDTFIFSVSPGAGTTVDGRGGANTLIGPNTANSWNITSGGGGTLDAAGFRNIQNLTGGSGDDSFAFGPAGFVSGAINGGAGSNTLDYSGRSASMQVKLQTDSATAIGGGFSNISSLIGSSSGSDVLIGANTTNTWNVTGQNSGNVNGAFSFSGIKNLTGGFGVDSFVLSNGAGVTGTINGGNTTGDWLDDSACTTPVTVNLSSGTATNTGSITNIQNVRGGSGGNTLTGNSLGNILIGGSGADTIVGGNGRSVLIGDGGADSVTGGAADDIVIGGTTSYDTSSVANNAALASILAEWQLSSSYPLRIAEINGSQSGGLNGTNDLIFGTTVQDDGAANTLTGGAGMDWFFKGANDTITDLQAGEQVN